MKLKSIIKSVFTVFAFAIIYSLTSINAFADYEYQDIQQQDTTASSVKIAWYEPYNEYTETYIGYGTSQAAAEKMVNSKKIKKVAGLKTHTITGLKAGTKYYVSVAYKEKYGNGIMYLVKNSEVYTNPGQVKNVKLNTWSYFLKSATANWDLQSSVDGYNYVLKNASGKTVASGNTEFPNLVKFNVNNNQVYKLTVRAFAERDGKKVYGAWSKEAYLIPEPALNKPTASASGIKLSWNKVSGATNYTVYVSTSPNKGYKKVATTTKTKYTIKKVNGKKTNSTTKYYVYVVANKKASGNTTVGAKVFRTEIKGKLAAQKEF